VSERITPGEVIGGTIVCVAFLLGFLALGMLKGCEVGKQQAREAMQREAIEHNAAAYDPTTGEWQWRDAPTP
jgi:hypothetical protein